MGPGTGQCPFTCRCLWKSIFLAALWPWAGMTPELTERQICLRRLAYTISWLWRNLMRD